MRHGKFHNHAAKNVPRGAPDDSDIQTSRLRAGWRWRSKRWGSDSENLAQPEVLEVNIAIRTALVRQNGLS